MKNITYNKQYIDNKDLLSVKKSLLQNKITTGPYVKIFEDKLKNFLNSKYVLTCSSGTAGLELAFKAINLKKNDVILMPVINFISAYSMANKLGAKICLVDVDKYTGQMTYQAVMECIKKNNIKKVKALVVMYLGGYIFENLEYLKIKKKLKCKLIEDACHAFGSKYNFNGKTLKIGSCKHSDISVFSFHPLKTITTGEGGAITTNIKKYYDQINLMRSHGIDRKKNYWSYDIKSLSSNYRLSDINCALGISQIRKINKILSKRKKLYQQYLIEFKNNKYFKILNFEKETSPSFHLIIFNINFEKLRSNKEKLIKFMNKNKIFPQFHYIPIYRFSFFKKKNLSNFFGAEKYFRNSLSFPLYYEMDLEDISRISKVINKFIDSCKKKFKF